MTLIFVFTSLMLSVLIIFLSKSIFRTGFNYISLFVIITCLYSLSLPISVYIQGSDYLLNIFEERYLIKLWVCISLFLLGGAVYSLIQSSMSIKVSIFNGLSSPLDIHAKLINVGLLFICIALYGFYSRYFIGNSFFDYFSSSRRDFFETASGSGLLFFQHYSFGFIAVVLCCYAKVNLHYKDTKKKYILYILVTSYLVLNIMVGNRLIFISSLITVLFYFYNIGKINISSKALLFLSVFCIVFSTYGEVRHEFKQFLSGETSLEDFMVSAKTELRLFPAEFDTLYEGHRVINRVGITNIEHDTLNSLVPNTILNIFDSSKSGLSRQSAELNPNSSGFAVHVYPYIAEGMFSYFPYITSFLLGFFSIFLLYILGFIAQKNQVLCLVLMPVLISNQFYYIRNELSSSSSLFLYSLILSILLYTYLLGVKYGKKLR